MDEPRMHHSDAIAPRKAIGRRWADLNSGSDYASDRWRSRRARERDGRILLRLLKGIEMGAGLILDAPSGAGRMQPVIATLGRDSICMDLSSSMLQQCAAPRMIQGSAFELPFGDNSFPLVVCCRLLHHLASETDQQALLKELARVSKGWVAVSHWDAASWQVFRRRRGWRRGHDHRVGIGRRELAALGQEAGLKPIRSRASMRFVSPQTWTLFSKQPGENS